MLTDEHISIAYDAKRAFLNYRGLGNYSRNLLALDRNTGEITDSHYADLADFLQPGDLIVLNDTKGQIGFAPLLYMFI